MNNGKGNGVECMKKIKEKMHKRKVDALQSKDPELLIRAFVPAARTKVINYRRLGRDFGNIDFSQYQEFPQHLLDSREKDFLSKMPFIIEHGYIPD